LFGEIVKLAGISGEESAKKFKEGIEREKQSSAEAQLKSSEEKTREEKIAKIRAENEQKAKENLTKKQKIGYGIDNIMSGGHFQQAQSYFKQGKSANKYMQALNKAGINRDTLSNKVVGRQKALKDAMAGGNEEEIKKA
jgi:hypothetical protein